ncbi:MAG: hypothetical protein EOO89_16985 [Pedobacter sp.]|nr:MAG: hypothetical protein EOO89_16985 [Pedobacter sp.]
MKTDLVEIFQTIRASLQPYAALGFEATINTEEDYQLITEKRLDDTAAEALFFASVEIENSGVLFCIFPKDNEQIAVQYKPALAALNNNGCFTVTKLDDDLLASIEEALSEGYKIYKEKGWV